MSCLFKRLCCIPSADVLTAEDHPVFVSGQEGPDSNTKTHGSNSVLNGTIHSKLSTTLVTPQDGSANIRSYEGTGHPQHVIQSLPSTSRTIEQGVGATLKDTHHSRTSENTCIDHQNVDGQEMEHIDPELHSDWPTTRVTKQADLRSLPSDSQTVEHSIGATFQDAHHFSVSGNARIVTIGQFNNKGATYGLDMLEKFVSFSALHDSSAQDPKRCCHPDTRKSVLGQICNWADDPTRAERILWLHGPAGVGKSAIAQTISYLYGRDKVGATFFFFRSDSVRNDGNRLFPTLAWQLVSSVLMVKDLIAASLENYPDLPRKTVEIQFNQLIAQPFLAISGGESKAIRVIIIDGLDECADTNLQERILKIIGNAVADARFPLRFIISSRPEADIQDFFDQFQSPTLRIDLAKVDDAFRDIETYLTSEFARIAVEQELDPKAWPDEGTVDTLVSKSSGQFVYAATVMKYVGDKYESAVAQLNVILGLKPSTGTSPFLELDALYAEILQRQRDQKFLKEFLPVLVARSMLAGVRDGNLHEDDAMLLDLDEKQLHRKLRGMRSLLKFEPFIDVHHKSFLDFLDDSSRSGEHHVSKHFANRRYMQLVMGELVKAASRSIDQPDYHEKDHFKPRFSAVTKQFPFPVELPFNDLEEILRPLQIIQEKLLQLPNMSVPWKPRGCDECWTFYMIDDLLLQLACFPRTMLLQEPKYVGIRPLTATEAKQKIPQLDLDPCLSSLLANLRGVELSLNVDTIGLVRVLVHFDATETAMKVRSITDAQNLIELICCLNKNKCFHSWFGAAAHNATRLALAIYGRVPLLPRSLFLNSADLDIAKYTYQGKAVIVKNSLPSIRRECFDVFISGNLSHDNVVSLLGMCCLQCYMMKRVSLSPENHTLLRWRHSSNPSVSTIQQIVFEVANAIQYVHSLGIVFRMGLDVGPDVDDHHLDFVNNHIKVNCRCFRPSCLSDMRLKYDGYETQFTLENNIHSFGLLFYNVLFNLNPRKVKIEIRPKEPEIPDNVWQLIQWCCAKDPKERPTIDQVVQEMESWISLGQFTLPS